MRDEAFGRMVRTLRVRRRWRQQDLAERAGLSRATVWRVEHGRFDEMTVGSVRRICETLEITLDWLPRGRGSDLDRVINQRHSALHESVASELQRRHPAWEQAHEVSFNVWGERGVIDLLLWHPARNALVVIELKTELVDLGDLLATMDRRRRLAPEIVAGRGWRPSTIGTWVIVARSRTNERRLGEHRAILGGAFPDGLESIRRWLRDPGGVVNALSMWRTVSGTLTAPTMRVRTTNVGAYSPDMARTKAPA